MAEPVHYNCSLRGKCENDPYGPYVSLGHCQSKCVGQEQVEPRMLVFHFAPGEATALAPFDQVEVIRQITTVTVPREEARDILLALADQNWEVLAQYPSLLPWVRTQSAEALSFKINIDGDREVLNYISTHNLAAIQEVVIRQPFAPYLRAGDYIHFTRSNGQPLIYLWQGEGLRGDIFIKMIPGRGWRCRSPNSNIFVQCPADVVFPYMNTWTVNVGVDDEVAVHIKERHFKEVQTYILQQPIARRLRDGDKVQFILSDGVRLVYIWDKNGLRNDLYLQHIATIGWRCRHPVNRSFIRCPDNLILPS